MILVLGLVLAAVFGVLRALVTKVWRRPDGSLVRQGNASTVILWVVGIGLHIASDIWLRGVSPGTEQLGTVSLLLYIAITLAAQRFAVLAKSARLQPV